MLHVQLELTISIDNYTHGRGPTLNKKIVDPSSYEYIVTRG